MPVRVRVARWVMRCGTWLAWRIAGRQAFGRWLRAQAWAGGRSATGPGSEGGDVPADWQAEPGGTGPEPLGGAVVIDVPAGLVARATAALWWVEEEQRANEAFLFDRADAIRRALIRDDGLLWALVRQAEGIAAIVGDGVACGAGQ